MSLRKLKRQLQKSPYVQKKIRENLSISLASESKDRILFGAENIIKLLNLYEQYEKEKH